MGVKVLSGWLQERHAQLHMARWMLEFDEPEAERAFVRYDDAAGVREARFALGIGAAFTAVYGVIDLLVLEEPSVAAAVLRFAILLPVFGLAAVVIARWPRAAELLQASSVLLLAAILIDLGTVQARVAPFPAEYIRASCTVTLLGGIGLLRLRMHAALIVTALYVAVCLTLPLPGSDGTVDVLARHVAPTLGLAAIALVVAYALERLRRTDFVAQREVELERARSEELLFNVLPVPIARRLRTEPGAIADTAPSVSVLFSDIVGFTPVSESLPAEELVPSWSTSRARAR